jgi:hypothetical protein
MRETLSSTHRYRSERTMPEVSEQPASALPEQTQERPGRNIRMVEPTPR